jgi:septum formation topological specificity factor MinE
MRVEITKVISRYVGIDENSFDIQMTNTMSEDGKRVVPALVVKIPIRKAKERRDK